MSCIYGRHKYLILSVSYEEWSEVRGCVVPKTFHCCLR